MFTDWDVSREAQSLDLTETTEQQETAAARVVARAATGPDDLQLLLTALGLPASTTPASLNTSDTAEGASMNTPATDLTEQPTAAVDHTVEQLLAWADDHPAATIRTKAARVRDGITALRERRSADDAQHTAEERVAKLRAELDKAQQELKAVKNRSGAAGTGAEAVPVPAASGRRDRAAIRTWARANGHEVADRGVIPKQITDAYDAAHTAPDRQAG
ncbi:histone-like nucleoid-structuring protein Lsr2 [Streptomyces sp. NPDC020141]|uniref:Lsr2 family DNA-binding protein n=1 Tax=Streptomyces sp. NPDC020141 TaxID=3365065 RepID=UPI003791BAF5